MRWYLVTLAWVVVIGGLIWASVVHGQMLCDDREKIFNLLASEYGEELVGVEVIEGQGMLEMLASPTTGTWTIVLTKLNGISCVMGVGTGLDRSKYFLEKTEYML